MFHRIVIGYDGSPQARLALEYAMTLTVGCDATVAALWVRKPAARFSGSLSEVLAEKECADECVGDLTKAINDVAESNCFDVRCVTRSGNPAKILVHYAKPTSCDLMVVGRRDRSALWRRLFGGFARCITRRSDCSLLIVKGPLLSESSNSTD